MFDMYTYHEMITTSLVNIHYLTQLHFFFLLASPQACGISQTRDQTYATSVTPDP